MTLPKLVLDDLARSGLSRTDAQRMQVEFAPAGSTQFAWRDVDAYAIPYPTLEGKLNGFSRYRFLGKYIAWDAKKKKKKPQRYGQAPGTTPEIYFPPWFQWAELAANPAVEIVITEGEKKAAALCKAGIPAVALGGVWNFLTDGEPIDDLQRIPWGGRSVVVAFDSDAAHKPSIADALERLRDELVQRGANPFAVDLPTLSGQSKTGVDDFLVAHGSGRKAAKAFNALPRRPLFIPKGMTLSALRATNIAPPAFVVDGLIAPGLVILAGLPKIGKSWALLDWLLAITRGEKVLDVFPAKPCEAAYLALEDSPYRMKERVRKIESARPQRARQESRELHLQFDWPSVEQGGLLALDRFLDAHPGVKVVAVDTLAKLRAAPKVKGQLYLEDYQAIASLKRIADTRGVALIVVQHTRKSKDDDALNQVSGSTGITGAADTILLLERDRNSVEGSLVVSGRDVREQKLALRWHMPLWTSLGDAEQYQLSNARRRALTVLAQHPAGCTASQLSAVLGIARQNAYALINGLVSQGLLEVGEGRAYRLNDDGKQTLKGQTNA